MIERARSNVAAVARGLVPRRESLPLPAVAVEATRGAAAPRPELALAAAATGAALLVSLAGTQLVDGGVPAWSRFWAAAYFILLLWPIGLTLLGRLAGRRIEAIAAAVLLGATLLQQASPGTFPLPFVDHWQAMLAAPGDAVRQRITLPPPQDPSWQRAWSRATRATLVICTAEAADPVAGVEVVVNNLPPIPLASLQRGGLPGAEGWYALPVTRESLGTARELAVVVRRQFAAGAPVAICGGQTDSGHAGGAARLVGGSWSTDRVADIPLPLVQGQPVPARHYVELRLYDADGRPSLGIWY